MAGSSLRYPRTARLLRPDDFVALRRAGKRLSLRLFQCEYRANDSASARLGMAVSRRVSKRAVVRNRIRRQIRESFRLCRNSLPCWDVLVIARTQAAEQNNAALRSELERLWTALAALPFPPSASAGPLPPALNEGDATGTMRDHAGRAGSTIP